MPLAPGSVSSYNIAPGESADSAAIKRKLALALLQQGTDTSEPVRHWTQGLAKLAQGALGGYQLYQADQGDQEDKAKTRSAIAELLGQGPAASPVGPIAPQAGPTVSSTAADSMVPRGFRNNNPLNIESGTFTAGQPGYQGSDGRFAKFGSMDQGTAAADKLLQSYSGRGINTVAGIVNRWAPPSDNNPTNAYAADVARSIGVDPNAPIDMGDPNIRGKIVQAMARFENGRPLPQGMAPVGAAVNEPRGGLAPDRRSQLISALSQTRSGAPFAQQMLVKQLDQEANRVRNLTPEEKAATPGASQMKASGELIFPPPSTNVSLNAQNTAESAYSKGKAEDSLTLERSADSTLAERQRLEVFKSLVSDFKTGKLAPAQTTAGAWGDALGIDPKMMEKLGVPQNAAMNGQLIESLSNQMTLGMIGTKGGEGGMPANNFSDADRAFLSKTAPGLSRMPGGNMILAEIKSRGLDRQLEKVAMWDDYRSQKKDFGDFERDWRKKVRSEPSIFADVPDMIKNMVQGQGPTAPTAAPAATMPAKAPPPIGTIEQGHRFKGGDPSKPESWEPISGANTMQNLGIRG